MTNENHWSTQKFGLAQLNAEKPYERPLALFNGFNSRDGGFIKFKNGVKKNSILFMKEMNKKNLQLEICLILKKM